jgi:hypothetical protein
MPPGRKALKEVEEPAMTTFSDSAQTPVTHLRSATYFEEAFELGNLVARENRAPPPSDIPQPPYWAVYKELSVGTPSEDVGAQNEGEEPEVDLSALEPEAPPPSEQPQQSVSFKKQLRWKSAVVSSYVLTFTIAGIAAGSGLLLWHGTPIHEIELWVFSMIALLGLIAVPLQDFLYRRR